MRCIVTDDADILNNEVTRMRLTIKGSLTTEEIKSFLDYNNYVMNNQELTLNCINIGLYDVVLYFEGGVNINYYTQYRDVVISTLFNKFSKLEVKNILESLKNNLEKQEELIENKKSFLG